MPRLLKHPTTAELAPRGIPLLSRATVLAWVLLACSLHAAAQEAVKVAFVMPINGPFAMLGTSQSQGATMAAEEINAGGGIKGRKLDVTVEDSGPSPTSAVTALRRVMGGNPVAIFGPFLGTQVLAMSPEIQRAGIPFMVQPGTIKVTQLGNPWLFRFTISDTVSRAVVVKYAIDRLHKKKIALLHVNDEYGIGGRDATIAILKSEYRLAPHAVEAYGSSDRDVSAQIAKIKASGADALLVQGNAGDIATVIKQVRQMKFEEPVIASGGIVSPAAMALLESSELEGVYVDSPVMPTIAESPAIREWVKSYQARWSRSPDFFALQSYEAVRMFAQVAASQGTEREAIRKGLRETRYAGMLGEVSSDAQGNMYHSSNVYRFGAGKVPKFVETIAVKP